MKQIAAAPSSRRRLKRVLILLSGICGIQAILFGPSLIGVKLLLPLQLVATDILFQPSSTSSVFADSVYHWELARRFTGSELRSGRIPFWDPSSFAGAPYADFGKYSPFNLVRYVFPSPVAVAWVQLLKAIIAGGFAYLFFRRVLHLRFWPATVAASLYPLTGFFILWLGDPISDVAVWYPALLVAIDQTVRRPRGWGGPAVALVTLLAILSGHVDIAGQVLLGGGLFALWSVARRYGWRFSWKLVRTLSTVACGWIIGIMLSAPYLFPLIKYSESSQRMSRRQSGNEERPPGRLANVAQVAYAEWFGTHRGNSVYFGIDPNLTESAAGGYAGLICLLAVAPLAWTDHRRRSIVVFLTIMAGFGLVWVLGIPGATELLRLPGLNLMSHNRLTFLTAFAVLALAATGLNSIWQNGMSRRSWFALPLAVLILIGALSISRAIEPGTELVQWLNRFPNPEEARQRIFSTAISCTAWCAIGSLSWLIACFGIRTRFWSRLLALGMAIELVLFGYGYNPQSDPALYYPSIPTLEKLRLAETGRVLSISTLYPNLHQAYGLKDVRGYDAIDPRWTLDMLDAVRDPSDTSPPNARTQQFLPNMGVLDSGQLWLPPILDLLDVRYLLVVRRLDIPQEPLFSGDGFFVYENSRALSRVYVPPRIEIANDEQILWRMTDGSFDPRQTAFVNSPQPLPARCHGIARIVDESPMRITVAAEMETAGLIVLADQWAEGWECRVDGEPTPLIRTNYGLRGIVVPAGRHQAVFQYFPPGLKAGLVCMGVAMLALIVWVGWLCFGPHSPAKGSRLSYRPRPMSPFPRPPLRIL